MKKLELNEKLAELYGLEAGMNLLDDSARMFDLIVEHMLSITFYPSGVLVYEITNEYGHLIDEVSADFKDHETPQAAVRFAIALYLVTLAENK